MQVNDDVFVVVRDNQNVPVVRRGKVYDVPDKGWWTVAVDNFVVTATEKALHQNYHAASKEAFQQCYDSVPSLLKMIQLRVERMCQLGLEE